MNDELIGGIRNALERGETVEQAMQTFLNAGYSPNEVREAAALVAPSATAAIYGQVPGILPSSSPAAQTKAAVPSSSPTSSPAPATAPSQPSSKVSSQAVQSLPTLTSQSPPHSKKTIIILIVALLILLTLLGITLLYSEKILGLLTG